MILSQWHTPTAKATLSVGRIRRSGTDNSVGHSRYAGHHWAVVWWVGGWYQATLVLVLAVPETRVFSIVARSVGVERAALRDSIH